MAQFKVWNLQDDIHKYEEYIKRCLDKTPYHSAEYLLAEGTAEEGQTKIFLYDDGKDFSLFPGVVRKINVLPYMGDVREELYDMITPHEYGGIVSNSNAVGLKQDLLENIYHYCKENKIIFQFVRINPFLTDLPDVYEEKGYELIHSNSQVFVNLDKAEEQIMGDYQANVRRNIRRAEREELWFGIAEKSAENIIIFKNMYQKAMDILEAKRFLYFNETYFLQLISCKCCRLAFVYDKDNTVIAAGIMLLGKEVVYYHLGCFDREYSLKRPMNYLMHSMILWSKKEGYQTFHLGGGGKSLMQFKEGYSSTRIDYYIANQICDTQKYWKICDDWKKKFPQYANEKFYPLYRYNE